MKAFNAKYKHGYLYDQATGSRILLLEESELTITIKERKHGFVIK